MARPVRFSSDDILDGTARTLALRGKNLTMSDIAQEIGGPTGSIYHRFASREELLATLWIRSIKRFHVGLITAYTLPRPRHRHPISSGARGDVLPRQPTGRACHDPVSPNQARQ